MEAPPTSGASVVCGTTMFLHEGTNLHSAAMVQNMDGPIDCAHVLDALRHDCETAQSLDCGLVTQNPREVDTAGLKLGQSFGRHQRCPRSVLRGVHSGMDLGTTSGEWDKLQLVQGTIA